ncbi:MAG: glycosyltransferase family 2 protein [Nodularia sp. (in: Bacteria)]|nr:MAG: glycosyltransferase family 2 protein [Nodularia sp. (in: cyanobacteria)]
MKAKPTVSIIINNYNYELFLQECIDSALNQTYPFVEVIVVDDGSTDHSHDIMSSYGSKIVSVLKSNGGQASSLNEGFKVCKGEIICFLDSDDLFHHDKIEKIVNLFVQNNLINLPVALHNRFESIDEKGLLIETDMVSNILDLQNLEWRLLSKIIQGRFCFFNQELTKVCTPEQVYKFAAKYRYIPYIGMPTSSISISRTMAEKVFPLPIDKNKVMNYQADNFITKAASLIGLVYSTNLAFTQYRFHRNSWSHGMKKVTQEKEEWINKLQDNFLNLKLKSIAKKPVFSFLQSLQASGFYRCHFGYKSGDHLLRLAFDLIKWNLDFTTLTFFVMTLVRGFYYKLRVFYHNFWSDKYQPKS